MGPYSRRSAAGTVLITSSLICSCLGINPGFVSTSESASETRGTTTGQTSSSSNSTTESTGTSTSTGIDTDIDTGVESESDSSDTTPSICGDGILQVGEECDLGAQENGAPGSTCSASCTIAGICGDGILQVGEECDDGNDDPDDGCSPDCTLEPINEFCGDGLLDPMSEDCDDGNTESGDGCDQNCNIEQSTCGNGELEWGEFCDDGDDINDNNCSNDCLPNELMACAAPEKYPTCDDKFLIPMIAPFQAIGLGCEENIKGYKIPITNYHLVSPDKDAWRTASQFGSFTVNNEPAYGPREGNSFLVLSTGRLLPVGPKNALKQFAPQALQGNNDNPDTDTAPPGIKLQEDKANVIESFWNLSGGNPNDKIFLNFTTFLPTEAKGYSLDIAFLSSEWPEWVNTKYSDLLLIWQVHEDWVGTISVISNSSLSSTSLHPHWSTDALGDKEQIKSCDTFNSDGPGYSCNEDQLKDTGFEEHAGTTWMRVNHNLDPGKPLSLYIFLADMGDTLQSSVALIDNFRYRCEACIDTGHQDYKELCENDTENPNEHCCGVVMPIK